jgi:hypothetical protein
MSLDIAVVPFLWILPLSLYLLTFILCFDSDGWYVREFFLALLVLTLINTVHLLWVGFGLGIVDQVVGYSLTLFVCCMCCHGELARMRPAPGQLTFFFLMVSIGGAVGGGFVAVVAPAVFSGVYEYQLLLVVCYALVVAVQLPRLFRRGYAANRSQVGRVLSWVAWQVVIAAILVGTYRLILPRNWYGDQANPDFVEAFLSWQAGMFESLPYLAGGLLIAVEIWRRGRGESVRSWWWSGPGAMRLAASAVLMVGFWSLSGVMIWQIRESERSSVLQDRNFYGSLLIKERDAGSPQHRLSLTHGRILHGAQLLNYPEWPTMYFGPETGIGRAIRHHPARSDPTNQFRVGVVGLGVGTLAAYANARVGPDPSENSQVPAKEGGLPDYTRFYEINPMVIRWAQERFTYLADAATRGGDIDVFEGDARIVLERQLEEGEGQRFDVLAVDAFSSLFGVVEFDG